MEGSARRLTLERTPGSSMPACPTASLDHALLLARGLPPRRACQRDLRRPRDGAFRHALDLRLELAAAIGDERPPRRSLPASVRRLSAARRLPAGQPGAGVVGAAPGRARRPPGS